MTRIAPSRPRGALAGVVPNPIWNSRARARLRFKHWVSWGVITLTITIFTYLMVYLNVKKNTPARAEEAAETVLPFLVVIQGVILMLMGTGAVASGISVERERGLLDYQRMTPLSPAAKTFGYLFGMPVREYALFLLTVPFVIVAAVHSGFSFLTLMHFYAVFFTSVMVYHMTGLVAGMIAPKPRLAQGLAMGLVVMLYLVLPNLSYFGVTFFEFLTIRPTFFGLIQKELSNVNPGIRDSLVQLDTYRPIPFFETTLHPTAYTLLVQSFLIAVMYTVVHRKWRDPAAHSLSKVQGVLVYAGVLFFLLASVWPVIHSPDIYSRVFAAIVIEGENLPPAQAFEFMFFVVLGIAGATAFMVIVVVTPSSFIAVEELRRSRKLGRRRPGFDTDGASSFPLAVALVVMTWACGFVIMWLAVTQSDRFFAAPPPVLDWILPMLLVGSLILFVQGLRERFGMRFFSVTIFVLWMVPFFTMMILCTALNNWVLGGYLGLPCPIVSVGISVGSMLQHTPLATDALPYLVPPNLMNHDRELSVAALAIYFPLALMVQMSLWWRWRRLREGVGVGPQPAVLPPGGSGQDLTPPGPGDEGQLGVAHAHQ